MRYNEKIGLKRSILKTFSANGFLFFILAFGYSLFETLSPMAMDFALENLDQWSENKFYFLPLIVFPFITIVFYALHRYNKFKLIEKTTCTLRDFLYRRMKDLEPSKSLQVVSEDALYAGNIWTFINLITIPIFLSLSFYLIWTLIGVAAFAGIGLIIIAIPIFRILATRYSVFQSKMQKANEKIIESINKVFSSLPLIQINRLEKYFEKKILEGKMKQQSKGLIPKAGMKVNITSLQCFLALLAPFASISVYLVLTPKPDIAKIFAAMNFLFIIEYNFLHLQRALTEFQESNVAIARIQRFLQKEPPKKVTRSCDFLEDKLNVIIGPSGSGKSKLLYDEFLYLKESGSEDMHGFLEQTPWIMNTTIHNNICFYQKYDYDRLKRAIESSHLSEDIRKLKFGMNTVCGENGCKLSYGQKKRVGMARLIYQQPKTYFLDEPTSGLNKKIAESFREDIFLKELDNTTRVIISNDEKILEKADRIFLVENGKIHKFDSKEELCNHQSQFLTTLLTKRKSYDIVEIESHKVESEKIVSTEEDLINLPEECLKPPGFIASLRKYLSYLKPKKMFILYAFSPSLFIVLSNIWVSVWEESTAMFSTSFCLTLYALFIGLNLIFSYLSCRTIFYGAAKKSTEYFEKTLHNLFGMSYNSYSKKATGHILNSLVQDTSRLTDSLPSHFFYAVDTFAFVFFSLITMIFAAPLLLFILPVLILGYILVFKTNASKIMKYSLAQSHNRGKILKWCHQTVKGIPNIYHLKLNDIFYQKLKRLQNKYFFIATTKFKKLCWMWFLLESLGVLLMTSICSIVAFFPNSVSTEFAILIISYGFSLIQDLSMLSIHCSEFQMEGLALHRLIHYSTFPKEKNTGSLQISKSQIIKGIHFKNACFSYPNDPRPTLLDINLSIYPGERIGIIGRSGEGKSTFLNLLTRHLTPQKGAILWGDISIDAFILDNYRSQIGAALQGFEIQSDTIREYIDPLDKFADVEIMDVLNLFEVDILLTKRLVKCSDFEKQILSLCQIFLARPALVLLDEPGANFDDIQLEKMIRLIDTHLKNSMIFITTHNLSLLEFCNKNYLIKNGAFTPCALQEIDSTPAEIGIVSTVG